MKPRVIRRSDTPVSSLPFSPAVGIGNLVFVSGQASVDATGNIVADSFEGEFRRSMENVRRVLAAAELDLQDVVAVRAYVDDPADLKLFNQLYREYFTEPFPARTTLLRCLGGVVKFEIDCIASAASP